MSFQGFKSDWDSATPDSQSDWNSATPDPPKQSTADWLIEQGLRTVPAVVGGFAGGAFGGPLGGMAGGAGGSAVGNILGNWYTGKEFNPVEFGVDTIAGGLPSVLGPAKLAGTAAKDLLKYGLKSAGLGALEGGLISGVSTPFQHYAQTGDFNASLPEYLQNVGTGSAMGGVLGGGLGAIHGAHAQNKILDAMPKPQGPSPNFGPELPPNPWQGQGPGPNFGPEPPPESGPLFDPRTQGQGMFPFMEDTGLNQRPPVPEPPSPAVAGQLDLFNSPESSFSDPVQGDFTNQFGPYRGPRGRFTREQPPFIQPGDNQYQLPFDPYQSYQDVPRETPFQTGREPIGPSVGIDFGPMPPPDFPSTPTGEDAPIRFTGTPTVADMAPVRTNVPPAEAPAKPPVDSTQVIRGVIFKDDLAYIIEPRQAIGPMLEARGYGPIGVKDGYPTWKLKNNIGETAFTRAQLAQTEAKPQESAPVEGMPATPIPLGDDGSITLPGHLATKTRLANLKKNGYVVLEERPNGDVHLVPEGFNPDTDVARQGFNPDTDIAQAKAEGGGLFIDSDNKRATINITKDYTSPLPKIMAREALQNALDAVESLGSGGVVKIRHDKPGNTIEVYDNGPGLDQTALAEKLTRLFATGKENVEGAAGGKGIGSASYIAGGQHFTIDTVAVDSIDGKKYRIIAGGTPDQFMDPVKGSDWSKKQVSKNTPTGTTVKTTLTEAQREHHDESKGMTNFITLYSRDKQAQFYHDETNMSKGIPLSKATEKDMGSYSKQKFKKSSDDKIIGDFKVRGADVKVYVPEFDPLQPANKTYIMYLNNGTYQFLRSLPTEGNKSVKGLPHDAIVDIRPTVDEQHDDYPFINTREHVKNDVNDQIVKFLEDNLTGPALSRHKNRTQELYDAMTALPITGEEYRKPLFYDPGNRLTPQERNEFINSKFVQEFIRHNDLVLEGVLYTVNRPEWSDRLEGVGMILDPETNGLHIPNPTTGKSSITFNPFLRIDYMSPTDAAWHNTITALHETAHVGKESGTDIDWEWSPRDTFDPRFNKYMNAYSRQMLEHGDVGYKDTGHKLDFMQRLGEVFSKYGVAETFSAADQLERIYTNGKSNGEYSPEVQKLLQIYKDSRGRPETTDDLLVSTGTKQADNGPGGKRIILSNAEGRGGGTSPEPTLGPAGPLKTGPEPAVKKPSLGREMYNFARAITTTLDLSAPLRQGLPMIFSKQFWTSLTQMRKALGDEAAFQKSLKDLRGRKLFQRQYDPNSGKITKSYAEMAGMNLSDLKTLTSREEAIASNWVEKGGFLGTDVPYLNKETGAQRLYKGTVGKGTRATNRAYTAFLNQLRADSFESLLADAYRDFKSGTKGSKNPYTDLTYAREIADFVNTATGRGPLRLATPGVTGGRLGEGGTVGMVERSGEQFAKFFTDVIFSPRLMASRIRMLNPGTYMMASPFVRKQYLKSLLSVAGFAGTVGALAKGLGADVSMDTNSADFGKIRMGNTRLDMAGGFQQYLVAASRLLTGHTTSSASGKDFELGQGYRPPTRGDVIQNFATNKLHPVAKFANDLVFASTHQPFQVGDRTLQLFVPLVIGDVLDLAKEDPKLLPLLGPIVFGAGSQTYDKGSSKSRFIPAKNDFNFTGGSPLK